jgi:hypothetical protein
VALSNFGAATDGVMRHRRLITKQVFQLRAYNPT